MTRRIKLNQCTAHDQHITTTCQTVHLISLISKATPRSLGKIRCQTEMSKNLISPSWSTLTLINIL